MIYGEKVMNRALWILVFLLFLSNKSHLEAFEISTHLILNEQAVQNTSLDNYLRENLGFEKGVDQNFGRQSALRWIIDGGAFEDEGHWYFLGSRYLNHFHNPLQPWEQAGLNDLTTGAPSLLW